ncbi:unnamed protein product [Echinostoma caproni]|uniref:Vasohibin-1 n=1 Tax=Echinostoma caproni TaxID=27848 RepID=A0A183BDY9_9TREM|nr:unnamed protein product [Echinostoma caproni]
MEKLVTTNPDPHTAGPGIPELHMGLEKVPKIHGELNATKSTGLNDIHLALEKYFTEVLGGSLFHLYNKTLEQGSTPQDWKTANMVVMHKGGPRQRVEPYRSVNLASILCKAL